MKRVTSVQLHVPAWERVEEVEDSEKRWPTTPSPDLKGACEEAMEIGQLLIAVHDDDDGEECPYALSGAAHPYYAYHSPPNRPMDVPGIGRVVTRYGFHPAVPEEIGAEYDLDPNNLDFQVFFDDEGQVGLFMEAGERKHMLAVGQEGDPLRTVMMRIVAIVHVLDSLDGIRHSGVLPYHMDTAYIAHQRIAHILRWQFKTSRTKPLFA